MVMVGSRLIVIEDGNGAAAAEPGGVGGVFTPPTLPSRIIISRN